VLVIDFEIIRMIKLRTSLKLILSILCAMSIMIYLDTPIARQIIVFVCITFIPGFLILRILKLDLKSRVNTVLFSVGLSIAFLMFVGLIVNELYPLMGVSEPLSILPLSVTIGIILLMMSFFSYRRDDLGCPFSLPNRSQVSRALLLIGILPLAIFGALLTNSLILLLMVVVIAVLVVVTVLSRRLIPFELHTIVILVIALSLLFHAQFISKYLVGWDVFGEFYVFRLTNTNSLWNAAISLPDTALLDYNAMLSVTILPTIYSNLLNTQGEWTFKVVYLLLYSLVPLSLYQMYKKEFGKPAAFLSAFYFVLFPRFYSEERRQIIGELFLVLLMSSILNRNINPRKKQILLIVFGAALVVSHYSISYLFMFLAVFVWVFIHIMKKLSPSKWKLWKRHTINASFVVLILILNLSWYTFLSTSISKDFFNFASHVATSFTTGFFSLETRGEEVSGFLSPGFSDLSLTYKTDYIVNKIPYFFIIVGSIVLIKKYSNARARARRHIQLEYLPMVLASVSILFLALLVPAFAPGFLAHRFYHVSLLFLAPVCILGGEAFIRWIFQIFRAHTFINPNRAHSIRLCILCILFVAILLFKVGFIFEVIGDVPTSRSVSFTRMKTSHDPEIRARFYEAYVPEQDVYSAIWLSDMTGNNSKIYADLTASKHVLNAYGMMIIEWENLLHSNATIDSDAYIYLRYLNVHGILRDLGTEKLSLSNITEVSYQLNWTNKIYSNGDSEIYLSFSGD